MEKLFQSYEQQETEKTFRCFDFGTVTNDEIPKKENVEKAID